MLMHKCRSQQGVERLCCGELHCQGEPQYVSSYTQLHNCILTDCIATLNITETKCGAPVRDNTYLSIVIPAVGLCSLVFVALRIYTRLVVMQEAGLDDWLTILLGVCFCAS